MKVIDLLNIYSDEIELHDGKDGKLIAKNTKVLKEKYANVEILSIYTNIKTIGLTKGINNVAKSYIYAFGEHTSIQECKENQQGC